MAKTKSMTRNQNNDDSPSRKRIKTCDKSGVAPWSDLNHDMLFLVMMRLGVFDFLAFSGIRKSWRSFAVSSRKRFMASKTPMSLTIFPGANEKKCHLKDSEGRMFKTTLPHSAGRTCVGLTCGYLILFSEEIRDFWLVNPITRHELHFPAVTSAVYHRCQRMRAILVFSPSISEWVFVMVDRLFSQQIWFSIVGKRAWAHVSTPFPINDLHASNGKIFTIHSISCSNKLSLCVWELRVYPKPKLMLLDTKNIPRPDFTFPEFISSGENLYVMDRFARHPFNIHELDFVEMNWVLHDKTGAEYAFYLSTSKHGSSGIKELWADPRYCDTDKSVKGGSFYSKIWYFFHDCLSVNILHEKKKDKSHPLSAYAILTVNLLYGFLHFNH